MSGSSMAQAAANAWTCWIAIAESRHATVVELLLHAHWKFRSPSSSQRLET